MGYRDVLSATIAVYFTLFTTGTADCDNKLQLANGLLGGNVGVCLHKYHLKPKVKYFPNILWV